MTTLHRACRAEWTKLRTDPAAWWLLFGLVAVTVGVGAAVAAGAHCPPTGCARDRVPLALSGVTVGQALAAVCAVLLVGGEYATGQIRTTLAAVPRRGAVLAAKATVLTGAVLAAGAFAVPVTLLTTRPLLPDPPSLTDGPTLRAAAGTVLYLALIALLALGLATALRDSAAATGAVLALLYLFPLLAHVVTDPDLQRLLARIGPMQAGLAIQATTHLDRLPIAPWPGLGVLTLWTAGALLLGATLLRLRDA
ncbi:ABC transporter permease subunit [Streptomyces sp. TLI_171]|uniref:ABC transporter permease subunit n=1 Tax=Streptomyces sp. TLI_171 TaxID=1938859 RepID=UPI000C17B09D|nr:ABC transporter permease subunit [Streptomyces sp. TLI_171]RKE20077.1 ABC-2 type transport system permease protein [Streptomyces sp. TLI_171]